MAGPITPSTVAPVADATKVTLPTDVTSEFAAMLIADLLPPDLAPVADPAVVAGETVDPAGEAVIADTGTPDGQDVPLAEAVAILFAPLNLSQPVTAPVAAPAPTPVLAPKLPLEGRGDEARALGALTKNKVIAAPQPQNADAPAAPGALALQYLTTKTDEGETRSDVETTLLADGATRTVAPQSGSSALPARVPTLPAGSDRFADIARQAGIGDDWIDTVSRDIASAQSTGAPLRFRVSPPELGALTVGLDNGHARIAVTSEQARLVVEDARPVMITTAQMLGAALSGASVDIDRRAPDRGTRAHGKIETGAQRAAEPTRADGAGRYA